MARVRRRNPNKRTKTKPVVHVVGSKQPKPPKVKPTKGKNGKTPILLVATTSGTPGSGSDAQQGGTHGGQHSNPGQIVNTPSSGGQTGVDAPNVPIAPTPSSGSSGSSAPSGPTQAEVRAAAAKERRKAQYQAALAAYKPNYSTGEGRDYEDPADKIAEKTIKHAAKEKATPKQTVKAVSRAATKLGWNAQGVKRPTPTASPERVRAKAEAIVRDYVSNPEKSQLRSAPKAKTVKVAVKPKVDATKREKVKVARRLVKATRKSVGGKVPEIVPPEYRKAVAKHGKMLNPALKEAGVDMKGPEYLGKLIQFESGWDPKATGPSIPVDPSGAFGLAQVIDGTAADFRERLGVEAEDPSKPGQMIKAAAMHASGKFGYNPLYAGYNPGYSDTDPIVSVDGGKLVGGKGKPIPKQLKSKAKAVIGPKRVKAIVRGGELERTGKTTTSKGGVPYSELKKYVKATESKAEVADELHVAPKQAKIQVTELSPAMQTALVNLAKKSGQPVMMNEGFRTPERQIDLASGVGGATGPAAAPGTSNHEVGQAVDLELTPEQTALLGEVGLNNTAVSGEPWHVELNDPDAPVEAAPAGVRIKGTGLTIVKPMEVGATPAGSTTGTTSGSTGTLTASGTPVAGTTKGKAKQTVRRRGIGYRPTPLKKDEEGGYYSVDEDEDYELDPYIARLIAAA